MHVLQDHFGSKVSHNAWINKIFSGLCFIAGTLVISFILTFNSEMIDLQFAFSAISLIIAFVVLMFIPANASIRVED